ncbi:MAG: hypothetical protein K6G05_03110 [Lachnospiraceae bacterium]|nr:hypothetical protein [Lachnospiraceae bacterium]
MKETDITFKDLTTKKKLQFIWDYYKIHIIITAVIICSIFSIVKTIRNNASYDLYVAYINVATSDGFTDSIEDISDLKTDNYTDLLITEDPQGQNLEYAYASSIKVMSAISAEKLDVVIADSYGIEYANQSDYLVDLNEFLGEEDASLLPTLDPDFLYDASGKAYAIDVSELSPFKEAGYTDSVYLGIVASENHQSEKAQFLSALASSAK